MPGKLDEISRVIGNIESQLKEIDRRQTEDRNVGDRRHAENRAAIAASTDAVEEVRLAIRPLGEAVAAMQPIVAAYQISRWKLGGAVGLAVAILGLIGLFLGKAITAAFGWLVERLLLH